MQIKITYYKWPILLVSLFLSSLLNGCGGGGGGGGSPPSVTPQTAKVTAAYFGIFDTYIYDMAMRVKENIPWGKVNRLYIAFAMVSSNGELVDDTITNPAETITAAECEIRIKNIVNLCRTANPNAEILISSAPYIPEVNYQEALRNPQKFADSVVKYVKKYNLDGFDMDWESPLIRNDPTVIAQLPVLFSTCRDTLRATSLNPHGMPYKVTTSVGYHSPKTVASLKGSIDGINIMSYGGPNADLLILMASQYLAAGFPAEKMIGGTTCETVDPETESTVAAKWSYVRQQNMGGMFAWRMDNDTRLSLGSSPTFRVMNWLYGYSLAP